MDIDMPVKDGYQTTIDILKSSKKTKTIGEWMNTTVCACTAYSSQVEKKKAHEAGMKYFLPKPVSKKQLEDILMQVIV